MKLDPYIKKATLFLKNEKRLSVGMAAYAFCVSISLTFGKALHDNNDVFSAFNDKMLLAKIIFYTLCFSIFGFFILFIVKKINITNKKSKSNKILNSKYFPLIIWALIFLSFIPAFLAYYPGICSYDIYWQTEQAIGKSPFTKFHPPIHTFIWMVFLKIGNKTGMNGVALYSLFQMLIVSIGITYVLLFIKKNAKTKLITYFAFLFYILNPIFGIISVITTKDVIFSALFAVTSIKIYSFIKDDKIFMTNKRNVVGLISLILLTSLFRNNAIIIFFVFWLMLFIIQRSKRKQLCILFIIPMILYILINGPIMNILGVKSGNIREAMSVPLQQISSVVVNSEKSLTEYDKEEINKFLDYNLIKSNYNSRFADPIKNNFKTEQFNNKKIDFLKLWAKLFLRFPKDYINAFLDLNSPYRYINEGMYDSQSGRVYIEDGYIINDLVSIKQESKNTTLKTFYNEIASSKFLSDLAPFSFFLSLSFPFWLLLFMIIYFVSKKRPRNLLCIMPSILLWLTYMLGPVSNFRYLWPFLFLTPFYLFILFADLNAENDGNIKVNGKRYI